jgi:hypothetical protein
MTWLITYTFDLGGYGETIYITENIVVHSKNFPSKETITKAFPSHVKGRNYAILNIIEVPEGWDKL